MNITFLGTGSAFTTSNYQTNTIINRKNKNLLIDAGTDIRFSLQNINLNYENINALYVTHLHADHIGGIEYLAFCTHFDPSIKNKIKLYGNYSLLNDLWNQSLQGGLSCIQTKQMHLEDYFNTQPILPNKGFKWQGIQFDIVQSVHVINKYSIVPSYGLMILDPDTKLKIYYTGDTQFNPNQIMDFYEEADLIIQDCETSPFKSGVHAHFLDLITLPNHIKKKMILQHYQDNVLNKKQSEKWKSDAQKAGFKNWDNLDNWDNRNTKNTSYCGFVTKGFTLNTENLWMYMDKKNKKNI